MAGNRTYQETTIGITTTTTNWAFNAANQMTTMQIGANPAVNFSYDDNGNLLDDGMLTYTWDRANRLKTLYNGSYNTHFAYDGNGDRHQQNIGGTITNYLLDLQPELALVLGETVGANTTHYVHSPMGIHSAYDGSDWVDMLQDGLGSVRGQVDAMGQISADQLYDPYGQVIDDNGTWMGSFGYAGEQTDASGLGYNRARYYNPAMGAFASLDPFEGLMDEPMSMNGYAYAHGDPVNNTDPSGEFINIIAGAIGGAVIGGALGVLFGVAQGEATYYLAACGRCGCEKQQEVLSYGYSNFIRDLKQQGLIFGATIGAVVGAGGPLASLIGEALTILGLSQLTATVVSLLGDFLEDGDIDDECRWVDFAFALLDIALGKAIEVLNQKRGNSEFTNRRRSPEEQVQARDNLQVQIRRDLENAPHENDLPKRGFGEGNDTLSPLIEHLGHDNFNNMIDRAVGQFKNIFGKEPEALYVVGSYAEGAGKVGVSDIDIYIATDIPNISKWDGKGFEYVKAINPGRLPADSTEWITIGGELKADFLDPVKFGPTSEVNSQPYFQSVQIWP